jgi:MoaA/NifB/PqqE/SkfB family radical SAM enzyme
VTAGAGARRPLDLGFELSNLCNLHCTHCIRGSHQSRIDRLTLPFVARVLDDATAHFDPVSVVFTGGEPLAAELFPDAVAELARRDLRWRIVTNGWLIPRRLDAILSHPPEFVRISLSGGSEETHDAQRGRGSFRRALLGAAVLLTREVPVELSLVVLRENRHELDDAARLAADLGARELHLILPQPTPESAANESDLGPGEWDEIAGSITELAARSALPVRLDYGFRMPLERRAACGPLAGRSPAGSSTWTRRAACPSAVSCRATAAATSRSSAT